MCVCVTKRMSGCVWKWVGDSRLDGRERERERERLCMCVNGV